jgi:hypothetical protein
MSSVNKRAVRAAAFKGTSLDPNAPANKGKERYDFAVPRAGKCDWADVDASKIRDAVAAVVAVGDALILAGTPDGGSFAITILTGGPPLKHHPHTVAECELMLGMITSAAVQARPD